MTAAVVATVIGLAVALAVVGAAATDTVGESLVATVEVAAAVGASFVAVATADVGAAGAVVAVAATALIGLAAGDDVPAEFPPQAVNTMVIDAAVTSINRLKAEPPARSKDFFIRFRIS
ncbi:MAG TPA: hypothetical protein VKX96_01025 [Chloroflexota bacterium]|nr:hypothetical protein [Chloroflexota bacterium]